ncbi:MAG: hypothetical protein ACI4S4_00720, partial [Candidatus Ornithospirochaeta sp.]
MCGLEDVPGAYVSYVFSFCVISLVVFRAVVFFKDFWKKVLAAESPFLQKSLFDERCRFFFLLALSVPLGLQYALFKIILGLDVGSRWIHENYSHHDL